MHQHESVDNASTADVVVKRSLGLKSVSPLRSSHHTTVVSAIAPSMFKDGAAA